ncbi:hypothetical protein ACLGI4_10370 [Streptomyces sp. HMX112]|uniref:hypothetical protein n=1 Tax=Streptomyces sp. HMX112 TaxID=3390850 RepID=UPI003A80ADD1
MSVARRPLLTTTAAGTLLAALWFVPSANATVEQPPAEQGTRATTHAGMTHAGTATAGAAVTGAGSERSGLPAGPSGSRQGLVLADTGSVDTTPYLMGGVAFLAAGAGLVSFAVRRGTPAAS